MSFQPDAKIDERTVAVARAANTWALNFVTFALLIDVAVRGLVYHEAAWDLLALVIVGGGISSVYMARHKVLRQVYGSKVAIIGAVVALVVGAVVAVVLTLTKAM